MWLEPRSTELRAASWPCSSSSPRLALAQTEQEAPPEPLPTPSPARPRGYAQLGLVGLGGVRRREGRSQRRGRGRPCPYQQRRAPRDDQQRSRPFRAGTPGCGLPRGAAPFAYATVGGSWFSTMSKLNYDDSPGDGIASTTSCSDWTLSWSTGAGVLVRVHRAGFLELGVHYLANLPVDWLAEGDLGRDPMGPARPQPRHSAVNLIEIVVGITLAP